MDAILETKINFEFQSCSEEKGTNTRLWSASAEGFCRVAETSLTKLHTLTWEPAPSHYGRSGYYFRLDVINKNKWTFSLGQKKAFWKNIWIRTIFRINVHSDIWFFFHINSTSGLATTQLYKLKTPNSYLFLSKTGINIFHELLPNYPGVAEAR